MVGDGKEADAKARDDASALQSFQSSIKVHPRGTVCMMKPQASQDPSVAVWVWMLFIWFIFFDYGTAHSKNLLCRLRTRACIYDRHVSTYIWYHNPPIIFCHKKLKEERSEIVGRCYASTSSPSSSSSSCWW